MTATVDLKFLARGLRIFYPWEEELPVDLLVAGGLPAERLPGLSDQPLVRIAKVDRGRGESVTIGAYLTVVITPARHRLEALAVDPAWRRRGVGSWLVGHALGVSESRGAREVEAPAGTAADGLFERLGFVRRDAEAGGSMWLMRIDPE